MKVYTNSVIDEDGEITGEVGAVLIASRELEYREVDDLRKLKIGEAGPVSSGPEFAETMDTLFLGSIWNRVSRYKKTLVRNKGDDFATFAFYARKRTG